MISDERELRPRYGEVDKMGYVYHANYISYCHFARTELMRKLGVCDATLEENNIMLPVITFDIKYKNPAHYDELLTINTKITEMPDIKLHFEFEITNEKFETICKAKSSVVFVDAQSRKLLRAPKLIVNAFKPHFEMACV